MDDAFLECGLQSVEIPASTEYIGVGAFAQCHDLETVVLHEGLKEVDEHAFDVCWHLKSIEWPKSLKRLGEGNPKSRQDV